MKRTKAHRNTLAGLYNSAWLIFAKNNNNFYGNKYIYPVEN
jgi:hypothetical protein